MLASENQIPLASWISAYHAELAESLETIAFVAALVLAIPSFAMVRAVKPSCLPASCSVADQQAALGAALGAVVAAAEAEAAAGVVAVAPWILLLHEFRIKEWEQYPKSHLLHLDRCQTSPIESLKTQNCFWSNVKNETFKLDLVTAKQKIPDNAFVTYLISVKVIKFSFRRLHGQRSTIVTVVTAVGVTQFIP